MNQPKTKPAIEMSTMKKLSQIFAVSCVLLLLQGCGNEQTASTGSSPGQQRLHLAFVANSPGEY